MTPARQVDGIDVFVEGDGDESIVMIHGWPDTYRLWDAQAAFFKVLHPGTFQNGHAGSNDRASAVGDGSTQLRCCGRRSRSLLREHTCRGGDT